MITLPRDMIRPRNNRIERERQWTYLIIAASAVCACILFVSLALLAESDSSILKLIATVTFCATVLGSVALQRGRRWAGYLMILLLGLIVYRLLFV